MHLYTDILATALSPTFSSRKLAFHSCHAHIVSDFNGYVFKKEKGGCS